MAVTRFRYQKPSIPALGNSASHLATLPAIHPSPIAAVSCPGVRVSDSIALSGSLFTPGLARFPRIKPGAMEWGELVECDRVSSWSRVISIESSLSGRFAATVTIGSKADVEGKLKCIAIYLAITISRQEKSDRSGITNGLIFIGMASLAPSLQEASPRVM